MMGGRQGVKGVFVPLSGIFVIKNWPQTLSTETLGQISLSHTYFCHHLSLHKLNAYTFSFQLQSLSDLSQRTWGPSPPSLLLSSSSDLPEPLS